MNIVVSVIKFILGTFTFIPKLIYKIIVFILKKTAPFILGKTKYNAIASSIAEKQKNFDEKVNSIVDKNSPKYSQIRFLWNCFTSIIIGAIFYVFTIQNNFLWLTGEMPSVDELQNPKLSQSSEIYSQDGVLLGKYFLENRTPVKDYQDLSPNIVAALVATEDSRFYQHAGIDFKSLAGVAIGLLKGGERGGGSTITQQLAKNLYKIRTKEGIQKKGLLGYIPGLSKFIIKTKEWITAIKLEKYYSKDEIILWYLNTVDYGNNTFGLKVAAKSYFNTTPDKLSVQEAAVLVGIQKATSTYNPRKNYDKSFERRNTVLRQMVKYKYLKQAEYDSISTLPIALKINDESPYDGNGNYFKTALSKYIKDWAEQNNIELDLYRDGLKIITSIDSRMQINAESAISEGMQSLQRAFDNHWKGRNPWIDEHGVEIPNFIDTVAKRTDYFKGLIKKYKNNPDSAWYIFKNKKKKMWVYSRDLSGEVKMEMSSYDSLLYYKKLLQAGLMSMDPFTGEIKAWVGGLNFKYFKYDHVRQGKRQPGSTFKPFVYTTAIDGPRNMSPCDERRDEPFELKYRENKEDKIWRPTNADGRFSYRTYNLRQAMAKSVNSIAAKLTNEVTPDSVVYYAKLMGIKSPLAPVASIGLGSNEVSLYEMVAAYGVFLNSGIHTEPILVTEIKDRNNKVLYTFTPKRREAIKPESAQLMRWMLQGGMEEQGGTSQNLWSFPELFADGKPSKFAGKTGTTSNHSDGWYMGLTHNLVTGVWVGGDDRCIHFRSGAYGEGSKTALPLFARYMVKNIQNPMLSQYHPKTFEPLDKNTIGKDYINCIRNAGGNNSGNRPYKSASNLNIDSVLRAEDEMKTTTPTADTNR
ncbi:MAG: transglycosylase domain-containing protein [Pseudarcicella sp.]|nr:transglycosylase domain-containing protein [Pseudarcicella sp.]MBP6409537.1 transglycosylase domain-containing protein [Pseudarcicella sp.]